jgi:hypothetical protein
MSEGQRPGGLTALAVINFVFGGYELLGAASLSAAMAVPDIRSALNEEMGGMLTDAWLLLLIVASLVDGALLITSGVGYMKQKRVLGRWMGNAYVLCSLAASTALISTIGMRIDALIGVVYPLLTVILINGMFKDDLVR